MATCYMYGCRCKLQKYCEYEFERYLSKCEYYEFQNAQRIGKLRKHYKKWYNNDGNLDQNETVFDEFTHEYIMNTKINEMP